MRDGVMAHLKNVCGLPVPVGMAHRLGTTGLNHTSFEGVNNSIGQVLGSVMPHDLAHG